MFIDTEMLRQIMDLEEDKVPDEFKEEIDRLIDVTQLESMMKTQVMVNRLNRSCIDNRHSQTMVDVNLIDDDLARTASATSFGASLPILFMVMKEGIKALSDMIRWMTENTHPVGFEDDQAAMKAARDQYNNILSELVSSTTAMAEAMHEKMHESAGTTCDHVVTVAKDVDENWEEKDEN